MPRMITPYITKEVVSMDENKSVLEAAKMMVDKYIGSVVVTSSNGKATIFTERDLMMKVIGQEKYPSQMILKDVVDPNPVTVGPNERCSRCLELMKENRCRHLLVYDEGKFVGIVTLRTMVQLLLEEKNELIGHLEHYITGSL